MSNRMETQTTRRRRKSRLPIIVVLLLGVLIIVFAFIMEAKNKREAEARADAEAEAAAQAASVFADSSPVQTEINGLEWIVPMPLTLNEFSRPGTPISRVNGIVIHYIGNPGTTAEQNRNFFENLAVHQTTSVSSNFIVDMDGTIVQCIPVDEVAYATGIRNDDTLSIEVCHPDDSGEFTREAYDALVRLTAWLCDRFGLSSNDVLRHFDVTGKECPRFYVENEDAWERLLADVRFKMGR